MFKILGLMILGIIIGYGLRRISFLRKVEVSISYTVFLLLFVLGVTIGSNRLIVDNLFSFGWQAALLALSATVGSILASWIVLRLFFTSKKIVLGIFVGGCLLGVLGYFPLDLKTGNLSIYILYALMFQIGISIGSNKELKSMISQLRLKFLLIPLATISGTLLFSAIASLLLSRWSIFDCMAVGSGFAYYSLSSVLITQFKEASIGIQLATELGTIALLANIFREMMALLGAPLLVRYFGRLAPISAAGVNSMDVILPVITRYSGKEMVPIAIFHGLLIDMSVPFFVSLFCRL